MYTRWGSRKHGNTQSLRSSGQFAVSRHQRQTTTLGEFEIRRIVSGQTLRLAPTTGSRAKRGASSPGRSQLASLRSASSRRAISARPIRPRRSAWRRTLATSRCQSPGTTAPSSRTRSNSRSVSGDASSSKHQVSAIDGINDTGSHGRPSSRSSFHEGRRVLCVYAALSALRRHRSPEPRSMRCAATSRAIGLPCLVMTTSSPAITRSSNADKCVFASNVPTVIIALWPGLLIGRISKPELDN